MKYAIALLILLPLLTQAATVTLPAAQNVTVENPDGVDITTVGQKWYVQDIQDEWVVAGKILYPTKDDRTQAVIDAQADLKTEFGIYLVEALVAGKDIGYTVTTTGTGSILTSITSFDWQAFEFIDGTSCKVIFRDGGNECHLLLFVDLNDETTAATTARANMVTEFAIITTAADAGSFIK